ncbi:MAG: glutamate racemase [Chlamydiae bacterium]|nr:glutamate racemase [Chlamydiota bacterium]
MSAPIGFFDSGVGGLTVFAEVAKLLPHETLIYLGDTARLPYGDKSKETVIQYSLQNASFLLKKNIKLLIISCFTASSHALDVLQKEIPIPIFGMMQSGIEALLSLKNAKRIAVLGTKGTIESGVLQSLIQNNLSASTIFPTACPLFVPLIEEGLFNHPATQMIARHYLLPLKENQIDTALLACTHYPLIRKTIQEVLGPHVTLIEPANHCAMMVREYLTKNNLLNPQTSPGSHQFYTTDKSSKFYHLSSLFFGSKLGEIIETKVS